MFHNIPRHFTILAFVFADMFLFLTVMKIPIDFHILDHCTDGYTRYIETTNQRLSGRFWSSSFSGPSATECHIGPSEACCLDGGQSQGKGADCQVMKL